MFSCADDQYEHGSRYSKYEIAWLPYQFEIVQTAFQSVLRDRLRSATFEAQTFPNLTIISMFTVSYEKPLIVTHKRKPISKSQTQTALFHHQRHHMADCYALARVGHNPGIWAVIWGAGGRAHARCATKMIGKWCEFSGHKIYFKACCLPPASRQTAKK